MLRRPALVSAAATAVLVITGALAVAPAASGQRGATAGAAGAPARTGPAAGAMLASAVTPGAAPPSSAFPSSAGVTLLKEMVAAWAVSTGKGVTIAVLSDGVDPVEGLAGRVTKGPDYAPVRGASDLNGTMLASVIAGGGSTPAQPAGVPGIAPGARILAERVGDYNNGPSAAQKYEADGTWQPIVAKAIRYAVDHGAGVIMIDAGFTTDEPVVDSAVAYAVSKNVILVGSELDLGGKPSRLVYPDSLPGVINFTAPPLTPLPKDVSPQSVPANNSVLISAPGDATDATGPGNQQYTVSGFDTAAGFVAGTAAIIKSVYPHITDAEVEEALAESATNHPAGGYNTTVGFGLINPQGALADASKLVKLSATAPAGATALSASARLGSRPVAEIDAVHHAPGALTGGGAVLAGLILLIIALLIRRKRPRQAVTAGPPSLALSLSPAGYRAPPGGAPAGSGGPVSPPFGQASPALPPEVLDDQSL